MEKCEIVFNFDNISSGLVIIFRQIQLALYVVGNNFVSQFARIIKFIYGVELRNISHFFVEYNIKYLFC